MKTKHPINDPAVEEIFDSYLPAFQKPLLKIRHWVFEVASNSSQIGEITETLKWGQPSYLTTKTKSGTTLRMDWYDDEHVALFFHCQTTLIESFRSRFGDELLFSKNRAILFQVNKKLPEQAIKHCIEAALTYHANKLNA